MHSFFISVAGKEAKSLFVVTLNRLKWPVLAVVPPRLCLIAFNFCQPFLIERAIAYSEELNTPHTRNVGYGLIGAYIVVYIGIAVCYPHHDPCLPIFAYRDQISTGQYQHFTYRAITMMRGGMISMLYNKATDVKLTDVDAASSLTLMSADIERIVAGMQTGHELWSNTLEVVLAIYLLSRQLGAACAVPIGVAVGKLAHIGNRIYVKISINTSVQFLFSVPWARPAWSCLAKPCG